MGQMQLLFNLPGNAGNRTNYTSASRINIYFLDILVSLNLFLGSQSRILAAVVIKKPLYLFNDKPPLGF